MASHKCHCPVSGRFGTTAAHIETAATSFLSYRDQDLSPLGEPCQRPFHKATGAPDSALARCVHAHPHRLRSRMCSMEPIAERAWRQRHGLKDCHRTFVQTQGVDGFLLQWAVVVPPQCASRGRLQQLGMACTGNAVGRRSDAQGAALSIHKETRLVPALPRIVARLGPSRVPLWMERACPLSIAPSAGLPFPVHAMPSSSHPSTRAPHMSVQDTRLTAHR